MNECLHGTLHRPEKSNDQLTSWGLSNLAPTATPYEPTQLIPAAAVITGETFPQNVGDRRARTVPLASSVLEVPGHRAAADLSASSFSLGGI